LTFDLAGDAVRRDPRFAMMLEGLRPAADLR
jgi:hypothetical protein